MLKINLLPVKAAKKREVFMTQIYVGAIVIVAVLVFIGWRAYTMKTRIKELQSDIDRKKKELAALQQTAKEVEEFRKNNEVLNNKVKVITDLEKGRDWYLQLLDQISQAIPNEAWINELTTGKGGGDIYTSVWIIKGSAMEKDVIGDFVSNLEARSDYFSSVLLGKISQKMDTILGVEIYDYELHVSVKPPS